MMNSKLRNSHRRNHGFIAADFAGGVLSRLVFANRSRAKSRDLIRQRSTVPNIEERQQQLAMFLESYEDLVETLCAAAQFGIEPKYEARYLVQRVETERLYSAVRPFLTPFLDFCPEDADAGLKLCGRPLDAFEALTVSGDLQELLSMDDGNMISRLTRTQNAIARYDQHLRLLAENQA
jgi:hypothetical protein